MLCCSQAFCQEAESAAASESETQWLIIPRVDLNPYAPTKDTGYSGFDFGNTSLYTLFEGGLGQSNFSYSVEGHLLSTDPSPLYQNAFKSGESSFIDWANISYQAGNWDFTVGKDVLAIGTFEYDEYDFDSHLNLNSTFWNNLSVYQWGGSVGYTTDNEANHFTYQFASSPFGSHPFSCYKSEDRPLYSHSFKWTGDYDAISTISSVNMMECAPGENIYALAVGVKVPVSETLTAGVDFLSRSSDKFEPFAQETSILGTVDFEPSDRLSFKFKLGYEYNHCEKDVFGWKDEDYLDYYVPSTLEYMNVVQDKDYLFGGVQCHYLPLKNDENLRLHGVVAYNNWAQAVSFNIGLTYYFDLFSLIK